VPPALPAVAAAPSAPPVPEELPVEPAARAATEPVAAAPEIPAPATVEPVTVVPVPVEQPPSAEAAVEPGDIASSAEPDLPEPIDIDEGDMAAIAAASDARARLTKRMARLAQERNALWRRVLATFTRSS
jgi:hypothetical protein